MDTNSPPDPELFAMLQIAAMLLATCMLGWSFSRCLRKAPGRLTHQALSGYFESQRIVDAIWLAAMGWWLFTIGVPENDPEKLVDGRSLQLALVAAWIGAVGIQCWIHASVTPKLRKYLPAGDLFGSDDVVKVDENGYYETSERDPDLSMAIPGANVGALVFGVLTLAALVLAVVTSLSLGGGEDVATVVSHVVLCGLWLSVRVMVMDLAIDVWPGTASPRRTRRTYLYYVQIFEQWKIVGVLVALLIAIVVAPLATIAGYAPWAASSFAVWIGCCLIFATCWNKLAYPAGRVPTTLPLPVAVNRYSAKHLVWAYFFTGIHAVMLACLLAGILAMNAR